MKYKLFLISFVTVFVLSIFHISYAQTQPVTNNLGTPVPTVPTIVSDYALDVQQGKQSVNNDAEAQNNQKYVADNENAEAHEETEAVEPVEKIEPKEAVEPQEAVESESKGEKSRGESGPEGLKQESGSSSENNKQSDSENKQTDSENSGKNVEGTQTK